MNDSSYDVSFSGLKTAVARWVEKHSGEVPVADVCASFQEAVVDVLTAKAVRACRDQGVDPAGFVNRDVNARVTGEHGEHHPQRNKDNKPIRNPARSLSHVRSIFSENRYFIEKR